MGASNEVEALLLFRLWCEEMARWFAAATEDEEECKDSNGEFTGEDALWFIKDDKGDTEEWPKWVVPCADGDNPSVPFPPCSSLILSIVLSSIFSASKAEFGVDVRPPCDDVEPPPLSIKKILNIKLLCN